jgi:hypothetical protein
MEAMSHYGRLWERIQSIRNELSQHFPHADLSSLSRAQETTRSCPPELSSGRLKLLSAWSEIEREVEDS